MADDIASQLEGAVESLGRFRDSLEDNNIRLGNSASIEAKINKLEADKLKLLEKANKAEGKRMKDLTSGMGKAAKSMGSLAMKLGVVGGILTMFKGVVDVLLKVDRHAAKFSKQLGVTRKEAEGLFNQVTKVETSLQLVGINLGEALHTAGALAQEFGQMSRVTGKMVEETAMYAKAFGSTVEETAKLTEHLNRAGADMDFISKGLKQAHISGNNLGVVFRDLSKNAGMVELYLTRGDDSILDMANRAAGLGKSLESFGKMSEAWSDVEAIGENIGKTAQLLGPAFEEGLGDLTELYTMYQNFQDDKLHERITEQLAKTMEMENGILISKHTNMKLTRAQVEQAAKLYGGDTEFMLRSIKYQKDYEAFQAASFTQKRKLQGLTKEEFGALNDAARAIAQQKDDEGKLVHGFAEGADLLKVQGDAQARLLKLAQEKLKAREEEADVATKVENILKDQAGVWENLLNMIEGIVQPLQTVVSQLFDENVMKGLREKTKEWGESIERIFSAKEGGAFDTKALNKEIEGEGGITGALDLMGNRLATAFAAEFDIKTKDGEVVTSWKGLMKAGWETLKPYMESAEGWLTEMFSRMLQAAWDNLDMDLMPDMAPGERSGWSHTKRWFQDATGWGRQNAGTGFGANQPPPPTGAPIPLSEMDYDEKTGRYIPRKAKGWAGGRHRAIVGEAGTEVGITRSALRELSSAGIPGYANGYGDRFTGKALAMSNRYGLAGGAGTVDVQATRAAATQAAGDRMRNPQQNFLEDLWDLQRRNANDQRDITDEGHDIALQRQKEFFTKYPALMDQVFGEPFRAGGAISTALYNASFAGMQAYSTAELSGATKEKAREAAAQHWTAEGLKPGGVIDMGLSHLQEMQKDQMYVLHGGFEKEQKVAEEIYKARTEFDFEARQEEKRLQTEIKKASDAKDREQTALLKEQLKQLQEDKVIQLKRMDQAHSDQQQLVSELKEIKDKGDVYNRTSISLLGGIQSGLAAAGAVIAGGGGRDQARDMAMRGLIGGTVRDLTASFGGTANKEFLSTMNLMGVLLGVSPVGKAQTGAVGRNVDEMMNAALARTNVAAQQAGYGLGWGSGNAMGRVYNSPHLAVVGEGSQNEIIVPTERIRKGLPINEGVARELASIGVPGYENGWFGSTFGGDSDFAAGRASYKGAAADNFGGNPYGSLKAIRAAKGAKGRAGATYESFGGWEGGLATMGLQFANTLMNEGDIGSAFGQAMGAGLGLAATAGISMIPVVGPFIGPILGPMIGGWIGGKLGGLLGKDNKPKTPDYSKHRARALKNLEHHVLTKSQFMRGQPAGAATHLKAAVSGKSGKHPSDDEFDKMVAAMHESEVMGYGFSPGLEAGAMIALLSGGVKDPMQATSLYRAFNNAFYGTPMATGGIVTKPTRAVIGEAGPEAVIPLNKFDDYTGTDQKKDNANIINELRKQNQQMQMFIKNIGDAKTVLNVDGRQLAETVGSNMYDINTGM